MTASEIKEARKAAGLSQEALAKLLGMSQTMLSRMEQGERDPEPDFRDRLRDVIESHTEEQRVKALAAVGAAH